MMTKVSVFALGYPEFHRLWGMSKWELLWDRWSYAKWGRIGDVAVVTRFYNPNHCVCQERYLVNTCFLMLQTPGGFATQSLATDLEAHSCGNLSHCLWHIPLVQSLLMLKLTVSEVELEHEDFRGDNVFPERLDKFSQKLIILIRSNDCTAGYVLCPIPCCHRHLLPSVIGKNGVWGPH